MINYAVCEINGKQYKVVPGKGLSVDWLGEDVKNIEAKVLLISESNSLKIGKPYLDKTLKLDSLGSVKGEKIRVARFHAKSNYRRVRGSRQNLTQVMLSVKNPS